MTQAGRGEPPAPPGRSALLLIVLLGAFLRLALVGWFGNLPIRISDERDYNRLAINLVERGEFAITPGVPTSQRPPLFPAAVAATYWLFGLENFLAVRLLQAALSLLNALLLHRLAAQAFSPQVAVPAAALYAFYPSLLVFNNLLLSEVLFTFLLCAASYALNRSLHRSSLSWVTCAGVLFGLAALTRSVLGLVPILLVGFLMLGWRGDLKRRGLAGASLVVAFAAVIAPWAVRNTRLERTFVLIETRGGQNLMIGNYEFTNFLRPWDTSGLEEHQTWYYQLASRYPPEARATRGQVENLAVREGIQFMVKNPWLTLKRSVVKFFRFWGLERESIAGAARGYFGSLSKPILILLTLAIFGSYIAAVVSGAFGLFMAPPMNRQAHGLFLLTIGFICALHTLTFGHSRYHLPLMPFVLLYSASAWVNAREIWARRSSWTFRAACGLSLIFIGGWGWEVAIADWDRYLQVLR